MIVIMSLKRVLKQSLVFFIFFFQAEDGIRDVAVTGVQTCALPIFSVAALNAVAFAYMKKFGATKVQDEPGRPISFEETGTVATQIPGVGVTAHSSNGGYHTFEMEADALGEVGHHGFLVDAQTMTAVLYHLATDAPYRAAVQREFDGLKGLYSEYLAALRSAYPLPTVPEPTGN